MSSRSPASESARSRRRRSGSSAIRAGRASCGTSSRSPAAGRWRPGCGGYEHPGHRVAASSTRSRPSQGRASTRRRSLRASLTPWARARNSGSRLPFGPGGLRLGTPAPNDVSTGDVRISFQRHRRPELRRVMGSDADGNAHRDILACKPTARLGSRRLKTSEMRSDWTRMQAT